MASTSCGWIVSKTRPGWNKSLDQSEFDTEALTGSNPEFSNLLQRQDFYQTGQMPLAYTHQGKETVLCNFQAPVRGPQGQ